jgi:hypothetical protein
LVEHLHGKEGVSGSSPEEGLKDLQINYSVACTGATPERSWRGSIAVDLQAVLLFEMQSAAAREL